jgi:chaperonin GroES
MSYNDEGLESPKKIDVLKKYATLPNIADELEYEELCEIGGCVLAGFRDDENSSAEWMQDVKRVMELSSLKTHKKSYPLPNSANIKMPIITKAAYEFSSRTYPEIIKDGKIVKARVIGRDVDGSKQAQADRVCDYMNYQLLFDTDDWELELDRLLNTLALIGFVCKKTYYDPIRQKVKSELCEYSDLIINADIKNLKDASRINHVLHMSLNDLIEHARSGIFLEDVVGDIVRQHSAEDVRKPIDVVEQHCYLDLDDDTYQEPYIVTFEKDSGKILRIVARYTEDDIKEKDGQVQYIDAMHFFTDYHFLVSPKGKFQSVGFGILMLHLTESINTILNQVVDAGQLANLQGGYIDASFKVVESGDTLHDPGQFKKVKAGMGKMLKDGVLPIQFKEPSNVLYQLLGLLIQTAKELSSSTEMMTGGSDPQNVKSGAMLALIEQGMKVFTSIQRRVYRSLTQEYRKVFKLDKLYLDPAVYVNVLDDNLAVEQQDFDDSTINIIPVADPNLSSDITRMAQTQLLAGLRGSPGINELEITKRLVETGKFSHPETLMAPPEEMNKPNPELIKIQAEIEEAGQKLNIEGRRLELEEKKFILEVLKTESAIILNRANAMKAVAQADQADATTENNEYDRQLSAITTHLDSLLQVKSLDMDMLKHQDQMAMKREASNAQQQPETMAEPFSDQAALSGDAGSTGPAE